MAQHTQVYSPHLVEKTELMFGHLGEALKGELLITNEDYRVLAQMNAMAASQYKTMALTATELADAMDSIQNSYKRLSPYLDQIDAIEKSVQELEGAVTELDRYSLQLEERLVRLRS